MLSVIMLSDIILSVFIVSVIKRNYAGCLLHPQN